MTELTPASAPLIAPPQGFSLLSWNVLLPNSEDGWWIEKYYHPSIPSEARQWSHRQGLIRALLLESAPDVIALQETHGDSFERDFDFLAQADYDHVLHRKFRFRNATFWKRERFDLARPPKHKNKTLITALRNRASGHTLLLVNAHLSAGPASASRLRQVADGLDQARKEAKASGIPPEEAAVLVCGDFNTPPGETAVRRLLERGHVEPEYREPDAPELALTSRGKSHPFGALRDLHEAITWPEGERPATMILPELTRFMRDAETGAITPALRAALGALFDQLSGGAEALDRSAVERWLTTINGTPDRGTEHRAVLEHAETTGSDALPREAFIGIYAQAVADHKFWAVRHDLALFDIEIPQPEVFTATYDYHFYTDATLEPTAIRRALSEADRAHAARGVALPNARFPSDHLPVAACYRWR